MDMNTEKSRSGSNFVVLFKQVIHLGFEFKTEVEKEETE